MENKTKELALSHLSDKERLAYEKYIEEAKPSLANSTAMQFFELYLHGTDCEEIFKLNPAFPFGAIIKAKIEGNWDLKRGFHQDQLMEGVKAQVQQTVTESVYFLTDLLVATHKLHGDKVKKFIQTGNIEDLKDFSLGGLKQYRDTLDMLLSVMEQGQNKKMEVSHKLDPATKEIMDNLRKPFNEEEASKVLEIIVNTEK